MRRVIVAVIGTVTSLVMLLSFKTHSTISSALPTTSMPTDTGTASTATTATTGTASVSVSGAAIETRYGPVQVKITLTSGKIAAASATQYPRENPRDAEINDYAVPVLNKEAACGRAGGPTAF